MALLNIENISNDLPTVFQETTSVQPQLDCINAITELKSQLSDNKQHYIFLNQEIKVNQNKRIEFRHTIKSYIENNKNLEIFEKRNNPLEIKFKKTEIRKKTFLSSIERIHFRRAELTRDINLKQKRLRFEAHKKRLQIENLKKNRQYVRQLKKKDKKRNEKRGEEYANLRRKRDESAQRIRQHSNSLNGPRDGVDLDECINKVNTFIEESDEEKRIQMEEVKKCAEKKNLEINSRKKTLFNLLRKERLEQRNAPALVTDPSTSEAWFSSQSSNFEEFSPSVTQEAPPSSGLDIPGPEEQFAPQEVTPSPIMNDPAPAGHSAAPAVYPFVTQKAPPSSGLDITGLDDQSAPQEVTPSPVMNDPAQPGHCEAPAVFPSVTQEAHSSSGPEEQFAPQEVTPSPVMNDPAQAGHCEAPALSPSVTQGAPPSSGLDIPGRKEQSAPQEVTPSPVMNDPALAGHSAAPAQMGNNNEIYFPTPAPTHAVSSYSSFPHGQETAQVFLQNEAGGNTPLHDEPTFYPTSQFVAQNTNVTFENAPSTSTSLVTSLPENSFGHGNVTNHVRMHESSLLSLNHNFFVGNSAAPLQQRETQQQQRQDVQHQQPYGLQLQQQSEQLQKWDEIQQQHQYHPSLQQMQQQLQQQPQSRPPPYRPETVDISPASSPSKRNIHGQPKMGYSGKKKVIEKRSKGKENAPTIRRKSEKNRVSNISKYNISDPSDTPQSIKRRTCKFCHCTTKIKSPMNFNHHIKSFCPILRTFFKDNGFGQFHCVHCSSMFHSIEDGHNHVLTNHENELILCQTCSEIVAVKDLKQHASEHLEFSSKKQQKCSKCLENFPNAKSFISHLIERHRYQLRTITTAVIKRHIICRCPFSLLAITFEKEKYEDV